MADSFAILVAILLLVGLLMLAAGALGFLLGDLLDCLWVCPEEPPPTVDVSLDELRRAVGGDGASLTGGVRFDGEGGWSED